MAAPNLEFTFSTPRHQRFSFPFDMVEKMTTSPSSKKAYEKLLKTCKWFFATGKILLIPQISFSNAICWFYVSSRKFEIFDSSTYKIWVTEILYVHSIHEKLFSFLNSKIYRCDTNFVFMEDLSFVNLKKLLLMTSIRHLSFQSSKVKNEDESIVSFEDIMNALPDNCSLTYTSDGDYMNVMLNQRNIFVNWKFYDLSDRFDVQSIWNIAKKRQSYQKIDLSFSFGVSISKDYITQLNNLVKNIIKECKASNFFPPSFQDSNKIEIHELEVLRENYRQQLMKDKFSKIVMEKNC